MASKLALRTLGVVALPGAVLAVAAPAASAVEVAPLSNVNSGYTMESSGTDAVGHDTLGMGQVTALPETNDLLSGGSHSL